MLMSMFETALVYPRPQVEVSRLTELATKVGAEEVRVTAEDGVMLYGWRLGDHERLVLCFSGNGGTVGAWLDRYRRFDEAGLSVLHVNYRGYPGSEGSPSEDGLVLDAKAAWSLATRSHASEDIIVLGKSLGGGVAVALASEVRPRAVVLESTFLSAVAVGAEAYPFLPVRWVMRNTWRSDERAALVRSPVLVLHGSQDAMIGSHHGRQLAEVLPDASFQLVEGVGHNDDLLDDPDAWRAFLDLAL